MKRNAFTLAETIMTLFIVGLVVTAAIPLFTQKQTNGIFNVISTPWYYCQCGQGIKNGLCAVAYPAAAGAGDCTLGARLPISSVVIGNPNGDNNFSSFDLSIYDVDNADNMYDIFQSTRRIFRVNSYSFIEDKDNLYIISNDEVWANGSSQNTIIGEITGNPGTLTSNVVIGRNNQMVNNVSNSVVVGNNNRVNANTNNTLFGQNLIGNGGIKVGANLKNELANSIQIGIGDNNNQLGNNSEFNIGDMIYGSSNQGLTFYTDVELQGQLSASTLRLNSDERLKKVLGSYTKGLKEVLRVEPVVFRYKGQSAKNIGVIAQDLQKIFPEAVVTMPDGYLGVNTDPVFFAMLNAMKEVNQDTDKEIKRQEKLQKELEELKSELETINACERSDFYSKIRCFFYDAKLFIKSFIASANRRENHEKV